MGSQNLKARKPQASIPSAASGLEAGPSRPKGLGFRVWGLGFRVQGLGEPTYIYKKLR